MDEVLSKRQQGCQGVGSRTAAHSKTIAYALAGIGVLFFLFVLCYTAWTISLRENLQAANQTSIGLLANNDTGPFTVSNSTSESEELDLSAKISIVQTTHFLNETGRLTTSSPLRRRKKGGRGAKNRKNYRKQIHQLISKLLGNGRVGNDENDRRKARNETVRNPKKKNGRAKKKFRIVAPGGRRRKKNRNTHRKTSPQRPDATSSKGGKRQDRFKGDSSGGRKGRPKVFGCERRGDCRRDKKQNQTDVKRDRTTKTQRARNRQAGIGAKRNKKITGQSTRFETNVDRRNISTQPRFVNGSGNKFNFTAQTPLFPFGTDRRSRLKKTSHENSGRVGLGVDIQQTEDHGISPSLRPPGYRCPSEGDPGDQSQTDPVSPSDRGNNSSKPEPCSAATCNASEPDANRDRDLKSPGLDARLGDGDNNVTGEVDVDSDEEIDNGEEADDKDNYGYDEEEEDEEEDGWKSNMETVFAEFDRERNDDRLDTTGQVKWNQSKESDTCDLWIRCKYNSLRHYLKQLEELPGCPCNYPNLVWNNQLWDDSKESFFSWETANSPVDRSDIYKPGAKFCIRSLLEPGMLTLAAQHCCYDNNQQLITRGKAAGTPNLISPQISWELHRKVDILPWIICKGDWYRYHKVVPPNNSVMCKSNPEDTEFYRQVLDLKNI